MEAVDLSVTVVQPGLAQLSLDLRPPQQFHIPQSEDQPARAVVQFLDEALDLLLPDGGFQVLTDHFLVRVGQHGQQPFPITATPSRGGGQLGRYPRGLVPEALVFPL